MKKLLPLILLLTACTLEIEEQKDPTLLETFERRTEGEVVMEKEPEPMVPTVILSETGSLPERLLANGTLEVGSIDAPLTLLVFTEHHCDYCKQFQKEHLPKLLHSFGRPGDIKIQQVILPLNKYKGSRESAAALLCAAKQNKGSQMHGLLFGHTNKTTDALISYAEEFELDTVVFKECLESEETNDMLEQQQLFAESLDVTLVPTLFLNGEKLVGLPYYADLRGMIENHIGK